MSGDATVWPHTTHLPDPHRSTVIVGPICVMRMQFIAFVCRLMRADGALSPSPNGLTVHLLGAIKVSLILNFMSVGMNTLNVKGRDEMSVHQLPVLNFLVQGWVISSSWGPERSRVRELEEMTVVPQVSNTLLTTTHRASKSQPLGIFFCCTKLTAIHHFALN